MYQTNPESAVVIENIEGNYQRFRDYILNKENTQKASLKIRGVSLTI